MPSGLLEQPEQYEQLGLRRNFVRRHQRRPFCSLSRVFLVACSREPSLVVYTAASPVAGL